MDRCTAKSLAKQRRILRVRRRMNGTPERPRLVVYKSLRQIGCQIIDDTLGRTLAAVSSLALVRKSELKSGGNKVAASQVGKEIAALALGKGIKRVVFDRRSYRFHGRVRSLADEARKAGLEF